MEYNATVLVHTVAINIHQALRYHDSESIRPILMRLDRKERHAAISMVFHMLANDITTPDLDKIFIQRIREEQAVMSRIVGEIVTLNREELRIDKLTGYEKYVEGCVLRGTDPWDYDTWLKNTCTTVGYSTG